MSDSDRNNSLIVAANTKVNYSRRNYFIKYNPYLDTNWKRYTILSQGAVFSFQGLHKKTPLPLVIDNLFNMFFIN